MSGREFGVRIATPFRTVSFHASESRVEKVGFHQDGTVWVIVEPYENWQLAPDSMHWARVDQAVQA